MIRKILAGAAITAAVLAPGWYERSDAMARVHCQEDMDCWNCKIHGNGRCAEPARPIAIKVSPTYTG